MDAYLAHIVLNAANAADQEVVRWVLMALARISLEAQRPEVIVAAQRIRAQLEARLQEILGPE